MKYFTLTLLTLISLTGYSQVNYSAIKAQYNFTGGSLQDNVTGYTGNSSQVIQVPDRFGVNGNAVGFESNVFSNIDLGDNLDNFIAGSNKQFSFSLWFKLTDVNNTNVPLLGKYGNFSGCGEHQRQYCLRINDSKKLDFMYFSSLGPGNAKSVQGNTIINDTLWHHVVVTYNSSVSNPLSRVHIYLDNVAQSTSIFINEGGNGDIMDGSAHLGLGALLSSSGQYCSAQDSYDGYLDDLHFFTGIVDVNNINALFADSSSTVTPDVYSSNFDSTFVPQIGDTIPFTNKVYFATDRFGCENKSLEFFRDSASYLTFGNNFNEAISGPGQQFALSFWFKSKDSQNFNSVFFGKNASSPCGENQRQLVVRLNASQKIELLFYTDLNYNNLRGVEGSTVLNDTNWHHVAINYDGSKTGNSGVNRVTIYIDSIYQNTSTAQSNGINLSYIKPGTAFTTIGNVLSSTGSTCFSNPSYNGYFDDFHLRIGNYTHNEVKELYLQPASCDTSSISLPEEISEVDNWFNVYPNPSGSVVNVDVLNNKPVIGLLTNLSGQTLKTFSNTSSKFTLDVSDLPSGIYLIRLKTEGKNFAVKRLIKF